MFYVTCNDISVIHVTAQIYLQADWRRSCTYGRAPNAIDILQGSLTCPSYTDTTPPFYTRVSDAPPHLVAFYDTLGIRRTYSRLKPRRPHGGGGGRIEKENKRPKGSHIVHLSTMCQLFEESEARADIFVYWSPWKIRGLSQKFVDNHNLTFFNEN